ncbi:hypothetical protein ACFXAO_04240 [Streptomyces lavendulae]
MRVPGRCARTCLAVAGLGEEQWRGIAIRYGKAVKSCEVAVALASVLKWA